MKTIQEQIIDFLPFLPYDLAEKTEQRMNQLIPNYEIIAFDYHMESTEEKSFCEITHIINFSKIDESKIELSKRDIEKLKQKQFKIKIT